MKKLTKPLIVRHVTIETKGTCTIKRLNEIIIDLKYQGSSILCPNWNCTQCKLMFPRVQINNPFTGCPCKKYDIDYLIKRVQEIINHFPKEEI